MYFFLYNFNPLNKFIFKVEFLILKKLVKTRNKETVGLAQANKETVSLAQANKESLMTR